MTELGSRLKEARIAKDMSLDDLQAVTKIQKRYLVGIEEGNYSMMPGAFYVRAFIKQYAEAVGFEPDEIFEQYKSDIPVNVNQDIPEKLSRVKSRRHLPKDDSKIVQLLPKLLLILGAIVLLVVFWQFLQTSGNNATDNNNDVDSGLRVERETNPEVIDSQPDPDDENEETEEEPATEEEEEVAGPGELQLTNQSGRHYTYTLTGTESFNVELVATGRPWLQVENFAGNVFLSRTLEEGESEQFDFSNEEGIYFNIGNVTFLTLTINGEPFEFPDGGITQGIRIQFEKEEQQ